MSTPQPIVILLAGAVVALAAWWILKGQNKHKHHGKEGFGGSQFSNFERDCLYEVDAGNGRYWRSSVDYASNPTLNPHYQANPHDRSVPLNMAKLAPHLQLLPAYLKENLTGGQYTPGCGDHIDTLSDDLSTQRSLYESGNLDYKRMMDATREDGVMETTSPT